MGQGEGKAEEPMIEIVNLIYLLAVYWALNPP